MGVLPVMKNLELALIKWPTAGKKKERFEKVKSPGPPSYLKSAAELRLYSGVIIPSVMPCLPMPQQHIALYFFNTDIG